MSNRKLRSRFGDIKSLLEIWRCRLLKFIGRTTRQDEHMLPKLFLSMYVKGSTLHSRPFRKNKDTIVESLRMLMPSMPESGTTSVGLAMHTMNWNGKK